MGFNADIVRKYLNGKFSLNDKILVDEFFESDRYSSQLNDSLRGYWEENAVKETVDGKNLDHVLDKINRSGKGKVWFAGEGITRKWSMKRDHLSPAYTTNWKELPIVK